MIKKIFFTVMILVVGGGILFLSLYDDGSGEKLTVPTFEEEEKRKKDDEGFSKSKTIKQDLKDEHSKDFEERKAKSQKEAKLDFQNLFREHDKKDSVKQKVPIERKKVTESTSTSLSVKSYSAKKSRPRESKPVEERDEEVTETGAGLTFSTRKVAPQSESQTTSKVTSSKGGKIVSEEIKNVIPVSLYGDYKISMNSKVEFRVLETFSIGTKTIKQNTIFQGIVSQVGKRITFKVTQIDKYYHPFQILGEDYEEGIYNANYSGNSQASITEETSDNIEDEVISGSGLNSMTIAKELIKGTRKSLERKSKYDVYLENGRQLILKY